MMGRGDDLRLLGLKDDNFTDQELKAAYRKMAMKTHPDKPGGSKEDFQKLSSAFQRLSQPVNTTYHPSFAGYSSSSSSGPRGRSAPFFTPFSFFGGFPFGPSSFFYDDEEEEEDEFDYLFAFFEHIARRARSRARPQEASRETRNAGPVEKDVNSGFDSRDKRTCGHDVCNTCLDRNGIAHQDADSSGVDWREYNAHPDKWRTCWACKNAHKSVMTEKMAYSKFGRKLANDYSFFNSLRRSGKSFHQRPFPEARSNEYFWAADLEKEASARGWTPRKRESASPASPRRKKQKI